MFIYLRSFQRRVGSVTHTFLVGFLILATLALASACSGSSQPTPTTVPSGLADTPTLSPTPIPEPTRIEELLARVPLSFANYPIGFGDYATARALQAGFSDGDIVNWEELEKRYEETGRDMYEGLYLFPGVGLNIDANLIGLAEPPPIYIDSEVTYFTPNFTPSRCGESNKPSFLSAEGRLPKDQIVPKLLELGYQEMEYQGVSYYALHKDYTSDLLHALRNRSYDINRIAFIDDRLVSAAATELITPLIDVEQGHSETLQKSESDVAITRALDEGVLAGAFLPHANINPSCGVKIPDEHLTGPNAWQALSLYEVALTGYRLRDGIDEFVMALYYPDPMAAAPDALELKHRWSTITATRQVDYADKTFSVEDACAPLTTEVIEGDDFSILLASCPIKMEVEEGNPYDSPYIWLQLQPWVLAWDPQALQQAYDNRPTPTPPVPDIDRDQAIALALERVSTTMPEASAVKDPHNPIAFSMTMGEAEELLSRDTEWSSDRLVWVVQFEGDSVSEDPFNRDHPKEYHYAVEVISAIDGTSFDSLRTTSPIFQEGVEYE